MCGTLELAQMFKCKQSNLPSWIKLYFLVSHFLFVFKLHLVVTKDCDSAMVRVYILISNSLRGIISYEGLLDLLYKHVKTVYPLSLAKHPRHRRRYY